VFYYRIVTVWLLACVAGCATRDAGLSTTTFPAGATEVALALDVDGTLLVTDDVRVNGQPLGRFVIDTGAGISAIDYTAAKALGFNPQTRLPAKKPRRDEVEGLYPIDSFAVGGVTIGNHVIGVVDLSSVRRQARGGASIAGVIGGDIWARWPFTVDYRERRLTFHARPNFKPSVNAIESSIKLRRSLPNVGAYSAANPHAGAPRARAKIDGVTVDATLDTAFGGSIVIMPDLVRARPELVRVSSRPIGLVAGAGGEGGFAGRFVMPAAIDTVEVLGVEFTRCGETAMAITQDVPANADQAIIGSRMLSNLRLTFDYSRGKVWAEVK
jgi:hypothetical protein